MNDKTIFKKSGQNEFCIINFKPSDKNLLCVIDFFKSDSQHNNLFSDYADFSITFYCKSLTKVKCLFEDDVE